jgi:hypothetical protein
MFVSWNPTNGWSHVIPTPKFSWQPQLHVSDPQFSAAATFAVVPSIVIHFNNVFSYTMTATPELDVSIAGDLSSRQVRDDAASSRTMLRSGELQVCSNTTAHVVVASHSELKLDVDFLHIHDDKSWDKTVYDSGVMLLESVCVKV